MRRPDLLVKRPWLARRILLPTKTVPGGFLHMEALVLQAVGWVVLAVEMLAALIVAGAVVEAVLRIAALPLRRPEHRDTAKQGVRLHLARWLMLALEFALAADILSSVVAPSWDDIGKLAAIAALRTVLNLFLEREIAQAARHPSGAREAGTHHRGEPD